MSSAGNAPSVVLNAPPTPRALPGPSAPHGGGAANFTVADLLRIIRQHKVLIGVTFVFLYALVILATFLVYKYAPQYTSEAFLRLIPPPDASTIRSTIMPKDYLLQELSTEAARIKDPAVLLEVLSLPEVKATSYYQYYGNDMNKLLADFKDRISVAPVRDTYLIRIGLSVKDKGEAATIVNKLVERYLSQSRSQTADEGQGRMQMLKNTKADREKQLATTRDKIATKRRERDMPALESDRQVQVDLISTLNNTAAELRTRNADLEAQLATVGGADFRSLPISAEMRVIIEADPVLRYYRQQVEQLDLQIDVALRSIGEKHRVLDTMRAQRDNYARLETAKREELMNDLRSRQIEGLKQEQARLRNMQADIAEQLARHEAMQKDIDQTIQTLKAWEDDEKMLQSELERINNTLVDAEGQLNVSKQEGHLRPAIQAREANMPSRPSFPAWLGGGFVLCLLAGLGVAFVREFTDQALRTPIDVTRYGRLPVLGCVPLLDEEEADISEVEQATRVAPQSIMAETFRQIRAQLQFSGPSESQRSLLITSPRPDDGKTAIAVNLAVVFAQGSQRTLLIDCNFRRPAVRRAFAHTRAEGLSNVLVGQTTLEAVVTHTELPNLDVLASGPLPPNPAELLGSAQMAALLTDAARTYERIVIDGPPVLLASDAMLVARQVDGVVLVARAAQGTRGTLTRAREQLARVGVRVIGAVLNGARTRPGGYFRQQYREFYDYIDEDLVVRSLPSGTTAALDLPIAPDPTDDEPRT